MLDAGPVPDLGVITGEWPMVVPTCHGYDPDTLYLHGSVASQSLNMAGPVCVTVTLTDGLVLARSVFEHTINYRSAMIYGQPRRSPTPLNGSPGCAASPSTRPWPPGWPERPPIPSNHSV